MNKKLSQNRKQVEAQMDDGTCVGALTESRLSEQYPYNSGSSNGRTTASEAVNDGSNPSPEANPRPNLVGYGGIFIREIEGRVLVRKDSRDKPKHRDKLKNARKRDLQSYSKKDRYSAQDEIEEELAKYYRDRE